MNNKNLYFLIDNNVLSGKKRKIKAKSFHKDFFYTKKTQEMFNNLYTKGDMSKFKPPPSKKRVISTQMRTIKRKYKGGKARKSRRGKRKRKGKRR